MKKQLTILILLLSLLLLQTNLYACFGDKLGISHKKGSVDEFAAQLVAVYIKEKTGIESIVSEFKSVDSVNASFKANKTDIIILTGEASSAGIKTLARKDKTSKFFKLLDIDSGKVILRVSKKRLDDIKFFTLNKVMKRIGKIINSADFKARLARIKNRSKFPKQAAREYLVEKDLI